MEALHENIPGHLVHPLNPSISVQTPGKPTFLFDSSFFVTMSSSLYQELLPQDQCTLPVVKRTLYFPYMFAGMFIFDRPSITSADLNAEMIGKACFICEQEEPSHPLGSVADTDCDCAKYGPRVTLNQSNGQRVLEHMGAHILYDITLSHSQEVCGLCLQPSPMCMLFLKSRHGASASCSMDIHKSTCANLIHFNYASAAHSSESSPCSNVPIPCPLCPKQSPAVWTYCLHMHFHERHKLASHTQYPINVQLPESEKEGMKKIWDTCFNAWKPHNLTNKKAPALVLSEAHHSQLALP